MTTIFVTGATGRVGRHVVAGLLESGVTVRALVRNPLLADLPTDVEIVQGDITDPAAVRRAAAEVDAAFLLWPGFSAEGAAPVVAALAEQVSRVVYLSSLNVQDADPEASGVCGSIEVLIQQAGMNWTFLRPGGFAVNAQEWAADFLGGDVVRMPYPAAGRSLIHERDIAAVAVQALLQDKHIGQKYDLTGPEVLTQAEQVATIADAVGKTMRIQEQTAAEATQAMLDFGADPAFAESALEYWASLVDQPEPVTRTVADLLDRPALTFREWAQEHADEFRTLSTAEVAERYVAGFRDGDLTAATSLLSPDLLRIAPLEGNPDGVQGLGAVMENAQTLTGDVEILSVDLLGPLVLDDRFAVRFTFQQRDTRTGSLGTTVKMSLDTVLNSRITREEIYYHSAPQNADH